MSKAKRKKDSSFENIKTKSVFLYGKPNKQKTAVVEDMQSAFLALVNHNIQIINERSDIFLQLIKNDKKDSKMRTLEKSIRPDKVNSAFCQNAFDIAVTTLSNRLNSIRQDMFSDYQSIFTQSKVLFAMVLSNCKKEDMIKAMENLSTRKDDFYDECAAAINAMDDFNFDTEMALFWDSYSMYAVEYKIPELHSVEIPLDSRLMVIEPSTDIKAHYVITITNPFCKNSRFSVPLNTSKHSLHKVNSNKMAGTVKVSIHNGVLKTAWFYKRNYQQPKTSKVNGIDCGIVDAFYCSNGNHYGSMKNAIDFYHNVVEPAFAELSNLRNKKASIKYYLHTHKDLPDDVRRSLIRKMDRLDQMMKTMDAPYRKKRHYYNILNSEISKSVKAYINSIDKDTLTVIEKLDIKEFHKSRKTNGMFSVFARGQLQKSLMSSLNWRGYDFIEVEPAFTSQVCPVCGNLDSANRNGKEFYCICCGFHGDADHVASINIRNRVEDKELVQICNKYKYSKNDRHKQIKNLYEIRHTRYLNKKNQILNTVV